MAIYGHKFKSTFETEDEIRIAKREWALSLGSFNETELVKAVNHCKETLSWMPTISEFLQILQKYTSDLGVPDLRSAYQEACMHAEHPVAHSWSHPLVYWCGRQVGWFELRNLTEAETFGQFEYHYHLNMRKVRAGDSIDIPNPIALEQKSDSTQARLMLEFAKTHQLEEAVACSMLYYLTLAPNSRARSRQYQQALVQAQSLGLTLPTES